MCAEHLGFLDPEQPVKAVTLPSFGHQSIRSANILTLVLALGGCTGSDHGDDYWATIGTVERGWEYMLVDAVDATVLAVDSVAMIPLGSSIDESPVKVSRVVVTPSAVSITDVGTGRILRYGRNGRLEFSIPTGAKTSARLIRPEDLAVSGDSLFILDMDQNNGITVIDGSGAVVGAYDVPTNASTSSIAFADGRFVVTTIARDVDVLAGTARFASLSDADGSFLTQVCEPDPMYAQSLNARGLFGLFRGVSASIRGNRIYCHQALSPIVQVFTLQGDSLPSIRVAPPFYRRGTDAPQSMNQLELNEFTSTWTEHLEFYPFDDGFLSVYTLFDIAENQRRYLLFRCHALPSALWQCGTGEVQGRPLAFIAPDTLVTIHYPPSGDAVVAAILNRIR